MGDGFGTAGITNKPPVTQLAVMPPGAPPFKFRSQFLVAVDR